MRYTSTIIFFFATCAFSINLPANESGRKLAALDLPVLGDQIKVRHSVGSSSRALSTLELLKAAPDYFEGTIGVREAFSIAVLDEADWCKVSSIPYGLPFVSGPPYVVYMPATSENPLSQIILDSLKDSDLDKRYGLSNQEIASYFVSIIGFHELGHMYATAYGFTFPNKWTNEFMATYFAYQYLIENKEATARLWVGVSRLLEKRIKPAYTSLDVFEERYIRVGIANYAWYQVVFLFRAKAVYEAKGEAFIRDCKSIRWPVASNKNYLGEMESVAAGFIEWARDNGLL